VVLLEADRGFVPILQTATRELVLEVVHGVGHDAHTESVSNVTMASTGRSV